MPEVKGPFLWRCFKIKSTEMSFPYGCTMIGIRKSSVIAKYLVFDDCCATGMR